MVDKHEMIILLQNQLVELSRKQELFQKEISELRVKLIELSKETASIEDPNKTIKTENISKENIIQVSLQNIPKAINNEKTEIINNSQINIKYPQTVKSNLEKFIGENLINKIGIIVLIIGVGIGAKYAIDNKLISPLTRIILGYLIGITLLGISIKLKKQYSNFSSVLLSGSMSIMYFITYFAYSFYSLIPELLTFLLMVLFTAFTVLASVKYNKQIIAHIGLVGAYFVPILLSDGSGRIVILFSYMSIINIGILTLGFLRYWKSLNYSSFIVTWIIYFGWYAFSYQQEKHFSLALIFISIFFITFYLSFLSYKIIKSEKFVFDDILLMLINSFLFYSVGYKILDNHIVGKELLGLFTIANAFIHLVVSSVVYKKKLADRNIFYFISGLVLVFITIAFPVQLDGNWVTMLWSLQSALLFWIGRTKRVPVYEYISYTIMLLAFGSIIQDWSNASNIFNPELANIIITPIFNTIFLTSIIFVSAFSFINILNISNNYSAPENVDKDFIKLFSFLMAAILFISVYFSFYVEIQTYWNQLFYESRLQIKVKNGLNAYNNIYNYEYKSLMHVCLINYTMLFLSICSIFNIGKFKSSLFANIILVINFIAILLFLTSGLLELSQLRDNYLLQLNIYYQNGFINIAIRYISLGFVTFLLTSSYYLIKQDFVSKKLIYSYDIVLHSSVIWILSSEWIHWMDISSSTESYRLSLSIIWGIYSLFLIVLGIWKKEKHLRISAIVLFSITLLKLFFFDVSNLETIPKTILFISLGILLLIISFLYNRFKNVIFNENDNSNNQ